MPNPTRKGIWLYDEDGEAIKWWRQRYGLTSDSQAIRLALRMGREVLQSLPISKPDDSTKKEESPEQIRYYRKKRFDPPPPN